MCSHPGVDKNIDVPLSDDRFFICIYIYVCIENTKMDRSFKNPYSIYFRMIVYDLYIYPTLSNNESIQIIASSPTPSCLTPSLSTPSWLRPWA